MMELHLVRHGDAAHVGRVLAGRSPGISLNEDGKEQAGALAAFFRDEALSAVISSPLERCRETAAPIAEPHGIDVRVDDAFHEIDVGEWTGQRFEALENDPRWHHWNRLRSIARAPGGEAMSDVLARVLDGVRRIHAEHASGAVVIVTHCDVIRPLLLHFLGAPLDHIHRLDIAPASVSTILLQNGGVVRRVGVRATNGGRLHSGGQTAEDGTAG